MRWAFLDRISELQPGERAVGHKAVASSEDFFADHFPGFPVLPGVLQIEALAQTSGKLIEVTVFERQGRWVWPIISIVKKAKFRRFVAPGHLLSLETRLVELRDESAICKAEARLEGKITTEAELVFVFNPGDLDTREAQERLERLERENLRLLWPGYAAWDAATRGGPAP
ncbi:MAG: 3-hydroxyacyl-ACP dehydratase FabZ family protein [Bradymonadia bacterium]|jgi:3-hydroxyacyl-[acyl-carrier-protein] dehydratase